jgi:hypothetical protein
MGQAVSKESEMTIICEVMVGIMLAYYLISGQNGKFLSGIVLMLSVYYLSPIVGPLFAGAIGCMPTVITDLLLERRAERENERTLAACTEMMEEHEELLEIQ